MKQNKQDVAMAFVDLVCKIAKAVIEFVDVIHANSDQHA